MSNWKFEPLGTNEIRPRGWLLDQLKIQAAGLCGHLDRVWPDVRDSRWLGGDREGWERVPYWLDGFIPLAWLLDDRDMQNRATRYIDAILAGQDDDGWICPCSREERAHYDLWAFFLIAKVLTVYADCSGDQRIQPALAKALACLSLHVEKHTLFDWGAARWYECMIPIAWLYARTADEGLLDLAAKLRVQGFDYHAYYADFRDMSPVRRWSYLTHVVNLSMSLRQDALLSRLFGGDAGLLPQTALEVLDRYHGMANGHFTGDECLSGTSPVQGTELCGVVEAMFSYENILAATGEPRWADRLERLAFNALPATISEDMWSHQYDQLTNQIQCTKLPDDAVVFGTNGPESHLFGLEPNFGCCTANFGQAWPKLALSAFVKTDEGIASTVLLPSRVQTAIHGVAVECELDTRYPFGGKLRYTVSVQRPVEFTLSIRVPAFAESALVAGEASPPGEFARVRRVWAGTQTVEVELCFAPELTERPSGLFCLWRGPLLYALPIAERWERREYERDGVARRHPYCDYEVYPQSDWAYGFASNEFTFREHALSATPFSRREPPASIEAQMAPVKWTQVNGVCAERPEGLDLHGHPESIALIPYGCAKLRMTEMPSLLSCIPGT